MFLKTGSSQIALYIQGWRDYGCVENRDMKPPLRLALATFVAPNKFIMKIDPNIYLFFRERA
jgi:hypothetical protein